MEATLTVNKTKFHTSPTLYCKGTFTVTRANEQTAKVRITGTMTYIAGSSAYYYTPPHRGDPEGLSMYVNTPDQTSSDTGGVFGVSYGGSITESIDKEVNWTSGSLSLHVCCNWRGYHNCDVGYDDTSVGSIGINELPYNPETPATNVQRRNYFFN